MADCRIVNQNVLDAVETIGGSGEGALGGIAASYKNAGDEFIQALKTAISSMEGETKDALMTFFTEKVEPFVTEDLPNAVKSAAILLEANRKNFEDVDRQISESINGGGK